jgi:hypothetical protein
MGTRLIRIKSLGLKGSTGKWIDLAPVAFLRGPNAAGKSTVLDAVALLVLGYHPTAGTGGTPAKSRDAVLKLASGDSIEVHGIFLAGDARWTFIRRWSRETESRGKTKGQVKATTSLEAVDPTGKPLTGEAAQSALRTIVGEPSVIDLGQLLGTDVTDTKRRSLLLEVGGRRSTWSPERLSAAMDARGLLWTASSPTG